MKSNQFDLSGRVALVTGGSKGLGKAMARGLAEVGADIIISSRHEEELQGALREILEGTGRRGTYVVADLAHREDVDRLASAALQFLGRVDILVNNAGSNIPSLIEKVRDEDWDRIVQLNLSSCMALTRALVPAMKERHWGRIIHISSVLGLGGKGARSAYCATKAGVIGLARAGALDLGPYGITVNCISPGRVPDRSAHEPAVGCGKEGYLLSGPPWDAGVSPMNSWARSSCWPVMQAVTSLELHWSSTEESWPTLSESLRGD